MKQLTETAHLSCFTSRKTDCAVTSQWSATWCRELVASPLDIEVDEQTALARLVPLLVCGEQSAIAVFHAAAIQHTSRQAHQLRCDFYAIEIDEAGHERVWQALFSTLPEPDKLNRLKRRAQLFFTRLGRAKNIAEHFAQVSQLDAAVGVIMWHLERSALITEPRMHTLARAIKHDEARHVAVSRRYAGALGVNREALNQLGEKVRLELHDLLLPEGDALEAIGIDTDAMLKRITRQTHTRRSEALA